MKINFTKSLLTLLVVALAFNLNAQEYIWGGPSSTGAELKNSTFDGGLNDWTTENTGTGSCSDAVWVWEADAKADAGTYSGGSDADPIASPTAGNGAVVFDSDFYDNGGPNGSGICPGPQHSTLTSPVIDCTGEDFVSVLFYEYQRVWVAFDTTFGNDIPSYIEVSNDGGATWSNEKFYIGLNSDISQNNSSGPDAYTHVNISSVAANQANVRFRFVWAGNYYFWIIDDVSVIKTPDVDLALAYQYFPGRTWMKPKTVGVACDSMWFISTIRNVSQKDVANVQVKVEVKNEDTDEVIYTDTYTLDNFPGDEGDHTVGGTSASPDFAIWQANNTPGNYRVYYTVSADGAGEDFYPADNMKSIPYTISGGSPDDIKFSPSNGVGRHSYPGGAGVSSHFAAGVYYNTCDLDTEVDLYVDSLNFSCGHLNSLGTLDGVEVTAYIRKIENEDVRKPDGLTYGMVVDGWKSMGQKSYTYVGDDMNTVEVGVTDFETAEADPVNMEDIKIEPNSEYLAIIETTTPGVRLGFGADYHYQSWWHGSASGFEGDGLLALDGATYNGFQGGGSGYVPMKLKFLVANAGVELPENTIKIVQNPVNDVLKLELSFDNATDVSYAVGTMTGSLLDLGKWQSVQNGTEEINVANLANGSYLIRIQTAEGIATKTFIVAR